MLANQKSKSFTSLAPRVSRGLLLFFILACTACTKPFTAQQANVTAKPPAFDDTAIQRAAAAALGEREGTIIIADPNTGRIRSVINPRLAFEQAFPPGSAIKPFTALVALRSGTLEQDTRIQCKTNFRHENFQANCSHKRINNSFKLTHALAYSCNYFFGTVAKRMNGASFFSMLDNFGLGARTGVNASETAGKLQPGEWQISTALGNDEQIQVTPIQLLMAYTALVNGGQLLRPRQAEAQNYSVQPIRSININPQHRALLIEGMQGCIQFGTAADAGLAKLPYDVMGKTGTSGASNGFRTQGWFVSFLLANKSVKNVAPDDVHLSCIVFLKRAHGSEAATVAAEFYRRLIFADSNPNSREGVHNPPSALRNPNTITVHLVRENKTVAVELENYVRGVLAAEASVETELEALKAQAIASRTFALKNRNRHQEDGYDYCSLTHCQRYVTELSEHDKALILRASNETAGQALRDEHKEIAEVYFHAACGGMTTNMTAVWGKASPAYLQTVRDDYCLTMSHKSWTQNIPTKDLLRALQSDERSQVGAKLNNIIVTKRDPSRRAEMIRLEGERRKQLRGWDFALIVNRVLGWNMLKSSRFEIMRAGNSYMFRGSGFGHGLGLCQEGAHVMAQRGLKARQILEHYFPGAILNATTNVVETTKPDFPLFLLVHPAPFTINFLSHYVPAFQFSTSANEHFRLRHPVNVQQREVNEILQILETARRDLEQRWQTISVNLQGIKSLPVIIHNTTADFVAATGQPAWAAGATHEGTMHLQPLAPLRKRGILTTTIRHEFVHAAMANLRQKTTPHWLLEGLAIHFAGAGRMYARVRTKFTLEELETKLAKPQSAQEMRLLYAAAYAEARKIIATKGEKAIWQIAIKE